MTCAVMFLALAGVMSSCKESFDLQVVYTAAVGDNNLSSNEINNFNDYLVNHRVAKIGETRTIESSSKNSVSDSYEQADNKAKADFENSVSKLNEDEIKAFIPAGKYFSYQWVRKDVGGGSIVVCEWNFAAE